MNQPNKPEIMNNIGIKILVAALCAISFVAGMYAHKSRQINACQAIGGELTEHGSAVLCHMSEHQK
ncbi:hypothetical protein AAX05_04955 [Moraxella bovoculi]|uniref:Uncharacterized protein n=3 Tax=Moraxella TaxID=475 RepID=A0AAC8PVM5_9GAMM|nr:MULTISPECIES: hypothetical protein [Moraxella]AKG07840.1 hypothetical protein AAX06_06350 [Moraxella bovoculi]AKG09623.1 hypothetical protein AAX05_04955 [Moraxella bovoculi]AKG11440.1 hypothetical protein AAX07_04930 [Moraxella bovoculi]AKG13447.1 hypothetical protein AAX11_04700 [Moraxella bovoculi]ANB91447.1 hypothetical protein MOVS_05045 [Moraxella ovis]